MRRFDSLYTENQPADIVNQPRQPSRRIVFPLYYFYRSLRIVLAIWILLLIFVVVSPWANYFLKKSINTDKQKVLGTQNPAVTTVSTPAATANQTATSFYLKKGDLEIKAPIIEGISDTDFTKGIGHHPDSVWPNVKGNVVVAGHSFSLDADNPYGEVFANLRQLDVNDQVQITYQNKKYTYNIFKKQTVAAKDMSLMGKADAWQLTFYTCDPPKTDWRRLVFQAELIKIE